MTVTSKNNVQTVQYPKVIATLAKKKLVENNLVVPRPAIENGAPTVTNAWFVTRNPKDGTLAKNARNLYVVQLQGMDVRYKMMIK